MELVTFDAASWRGRLAARKAVSGPFGSRVRTKKDKWASLHHFPSADWSYSVAAEADHFFDAESSRGHYSARKALSGLTRIARRAGRKQASTVAPREREKLP